MKQFLFFFLLAGTVTVAAAQSQPQAQDPKAKPKEESPVFRRTHKPTEVLSVPESDVLDQMWQAFDAAQKAHAGDMVAQHDLGLRYIVGRGVERDTGRAAYWFRRASDQGLLASRFNLSILTFHGWGVAWDPFRSYELARSCAEGGMPEAQLLLGSFLTEGLVVPRDWKAALEWVEKAAAGGSDAAARALPEFRMRAEAMKGGKDREVPLVADAVMDTATSGSKGQKLLKDVFHGSEELRNALGISRMMDDSAHVDSVGLTIVRRAATYGSPEALTVLGRSYEKGIEVKIDTMEAAALYVRALRLDSRRAADLIMGLLKRPAFVATLKQQTQRGNLRAAYITAALAGLGIESGVNEQRAAQLLKQSAEGGYVPGEVEYGLWFFTGKVVPEDRHRAREWWYRAASAGSMEASIRLAVASLRDSADSPTHAAQFGLLRAAASEGSLLAGMALGYAYEQGIGVTQDLGEAATWYRSSASRGSQDAYRALLRMYDAVRPPGAEYKIEE